MNSYFEYDFSEYRDFFDRLNQAAKGEFKRKLILWLDAIGNEFLRLAEEEIIRRKVIDKRFLLNSFHKGDQNNVYILNADDLILEVGTSISYASYVNDGHWKNPRGVNQRWVPGYWNGDNFIYDPSAKTGMLLKQGWVRGKPYFDSALRLIAPIFNESLERKIEEWFEEYF